MKRDDAQLLAAARAGEGRAMDELLARYEGAIYRFGLRMCGDEESAREVLQETLLAAFRNLPGFRGEASLSTWLYQIARSFCIKARRHQRPERDLSSEPPDTGPGPDAAVYAREIGAALATGIRALPADQREALVLRDVEGLSAEEAAAVVGIEVRALKSRLHRARLELRSHLSALLGEDAEVGGSPPCPELAQELAAYTSAEIDQATCVKIEEHLERCVRCRGACAALKRTVALCRRIPGDEVPPEVRTAVRVALRSVLLPTRAAR
jgi:RNA polymerase sigma-70 factor (ECF subfamily)